MNLNLDKQNEIFTGQSKVPPGEKHPIKSSRYSDSQ